MFCGVQPSSSASTFLCFVFGIENIVDWTADFPQKVTEQVDCVRASCHKLDSIIDPLFKPQNIPSTHDSAQNIAGAIAWKVGW